MACLANKDRLCHQIIVGTDLAKDKVAKGLLHSAEGDRLAASIGYVPGCGVGLRRSAA